jgi:hypothetical protein
VIETSAINMNTLFERLATLGPSSLEILLEEFLQPLDVSQ